MTKKRRQIIGVDLYIGYMITKQFILWGVDISHVPPSYGHVCD